jgi:integrase
VSRDTRRPWKHSGVTLGFVRRGYYWIDKVVHGRRHRFSTRCATPEAALDEFRRWEANPAGYVPRSAAGSSWDDAVVAYLKHAETITQNSGRWVDKKEAYLAAFGAWTRGGSRVFVSLDSFTGQDIRDFLGALNAGKVTGHPSGPATFNRALASLKGLMRWARDTARVTVNRADEEVLLVSEDKGKHLPKALDESVWRPLLRELDLRWRAAATVQLGAGLRYGEVARLRAEDIHAHAIHVAKAKGRRGRTVPASAVTVAAARRLVALGGVPDDEGGQFNHRLAVAAKRAGLPQDATTHAFRHTYAICTLKSLLRAGLGLQELKERLGHASIRTTEVYLRAARAEGGVRQVIGAPL